MRWFSTSPLTRLLLLTSLCLAGPLPTAIAGVGYTGDIEAGSPPAPSDPNTWTSSIDGYVGYSAAGTLAVAPGNNLSSTIGYIGYNSGAVGTATVNGTGTWINTGILSIGNAVSGNGTLKIMDGGTVSNTMCYLCSSSGSTSAVTVSGAGSKWINSEALVVGFFFEGATTLDIKQGAAVTAASVSTDSNSLLTIDVGNGSSLNVVGELSNNGKVRIIAGTNATAGTTYAPISAGGWSGFGTYQAVGGTWNADYTFTASSIASGTSGTSVATGLRDVIADAATGWSIGASFATPVTLTATAISGGLRTDLEKQLAPGQSLLGGWNFTNISGYAANDPAYLSFGIGPGYDYDSLHLWHYDGIVWTKYAATDLTYEGTYASFTVTGFSGYAISGVMVPEPGALALLAAAGLGLLAYAWRKRTNGT